MFADESARLGAVTVKAPIVSRREWNQLAVTISEIPGRMPVFVVPRLDAHHLVLLTFEGTVSLRKRQLNGAEEQAIEMHGHDIHVTSAGTAPHELGWHASGPPVSKAVHVQLHRDVTTRLREQQGTQGSSEIVTGVLHDPLIEQLMQSLACVVESEDRADSLYIETVTELLGLQLLREHAQTLPTSRPHQHRGLPPGRLRRVQEYTDAHLGDEIRLADLAREAKLSPFHFLRAFKVATGLTPREYVQQCRVERSKLLLEGSDLPMEQIALAVGFAGQSHLATRFRNSTGITPSAYRRQHLSR